MNVHGLISFTLSFCFSVFNVTKSAFPVVFQLLPLFVQGGSNTIEGLSEHENISTVSITYRKYKGHLKIEF